MLISSGKENLNRILVLNPKGGCGKTTIATNLASYYAKRGFEPSIMDFDPQGSTMSWLEKRPASAAAVHGVAAFKQSIHATRSWQHRIPAETTRLIVDSPASLGHDELREMTRDATSILVPVLPSAIDIRAASKCIADLLLVAKVDRREQKLAVVANRTRANTRSLDMLMRFLSSLGIPIIAVLRDSQNFVHAVENGLGISELQPHKVRKDMAELDKIIAWLDSWKERRRDPLADYVGMEAANVTPFRKPGAVGS